MNIPYALRSKFTNTCKESIVAQQDMLSAGRTIDIHLEVGGYSGEVIFTISDGNSMDFDTNWNASDVTRFPARLKAVATALRDCGIAGRFAASHTNGVLSLKKTA